MRPDHHAAWAWLGIAVLIVGYVTSFDLWAYFTHHRTMTGQMRNWLHDPVIGPFAFGILIAIAAGLMYHFLVSGPHT